MMDAPNLPPDPRSLPPDPRKPTAIDDAPPDPRWDPASLLRLCAIDPARYGWTALGGVADLLTPHEVRVRAC